MNWLKDARLDIGGRRNGWLWMLSLFLVGLGAKLWLIHRFGTPLPIWDQWDEARVVYLPYFEGKLSLADLFTAHCEHRIFFTRIYSLGLLLLNRQWDGQLQMVVNAIIHCATLAGLGWLMSRWLEKRYWILLWLPLCLALALPFGWENSLAGFQSQFYFLVVFSLLTLWLLGLHAPKIGPVVVRGRGCRHGAVHGRVRVPGRRRHICVGCASHLRSARTAGNSRSRRWPSAPRWQWPGSC